jgi:hypothetical protein
MAGKAGVKGWGEAACPTAFRGDRASTRQRFTLDAQPSAQNHQAEGGVCSSTPTPASRRGSPKAVLILTFGK